jgi:hypothetical protein
MIKHDFTNNKAAIERYATMKLTLNNPNCEAVYEPIKNKMDKKRCRELLQKF